MSSPNLLPAWQLLQTKGWQTLGHPPWHHAIGAHFPVPFSLPSHMADFQSLFLSFAFFSAPAHPVHRSQHLSGVVQGWHHPCLPFISGARLPPQGCLHWKLSVPGCCSPPPSRPGCSTGWNGGAAHSLLLCQWLAITFLSRPCGRAWLACCLLC